MGFKDALNKGIKKVGEQANKENIKKVFNKAKEKALEEKSNKDLFVEGALGAAVGIAFGGALLPVIAGAALEGVVMKQVTKKYAEHKARKQGPKPEQPE